MQYKMPFSVSLIMNKDVVKDNCGNCQLFVNDHKSFFVLQLFSLGYIKKFCKAVFFVASHAGVFRGARFLRDEQRAPLNTPAWEAMFFVVSKKQKSI